MLRRVAVKLLSVSQSTTNTQLQQRLLLGPHYQKRMSSSLSEGKLSGKVAIVTASTEGIGYAIAQRLAQDGAQVMVSSRKADKVEQAVQKLKAESLSVEGMVCHAGKSEDRTKLVEQTLESFGAIDILVSNAGINPIFGPILDTSEEAWDKIFDLNVKSAFLLTKEVVPHIEKRGGGSVIYISSIGAFATAPGLGAYCVSKTALLGLTKALTPELAGMDIRVNCVCPGIIKTKFSTALWNADPGISEFLQNQIPLGRFGESSEISGIVSFLASQDASYITGESFVAAGGSPSKL